MTDPGPLNSVGLELAHQAPAIIAAITGLVAAIAAVRNGRRATIAATNAAEAATKAEHVANKTEEIREATTKLTQQAETIQAQTDGQLSHVIGTNEALREILAKFMAILSAREGKAMAVRVDDLKAGGVSLGLPLVDTPNGERAQRRRSTDLEEPPP